MAQAKPTAQGAVDLQDGSEQTKAPDYFRAKTGRVFEATPYLVKQYRKNKFGLVGISKAEYEDALEDEAKESPKESAADAAEKESLANENAELKAKIEAMEKAQSEKVTSTGGTKRTASTSKA
ncbi:hypothetical protein [Alteromonas mediterranea]|uniref:hypothetical protein n=1 Tax=Alteromonas mediterranea TaxID=314275 RepID=UPI00241F1DBF|nr:hypothetical protein [Alteromonas mediterranea]|tara:strand:- start:933 stop:1301 length:369 start_codon:yes stop_codon:yes gene_type:complete